MIGYVVGFLFSENKQKVILIGKNRPTWQEGKLNGVGGKIEDGETPVDAILREFKEETAYDTSCLYWENFLVLTDLNNKWRIFFFRAFGDIRRAYTNTDEIIYEVDANFIYSYDTIPNLRWIVPLALHSADIVLPLQVFDNDDSP